MENLKMQHKLLEYRPVLVLFFDGLPIIEMCGILPEVKEVGE